MANEIETKYPRCKQFTSIILKELFEFCVKARRLYNKKKGIEDKPKAIKLVNLLAIGLHYCEGSEYVMASVIFDLFENDELVLEKSDDLSYFIFLYLLMPSTGSLLTIKEVQNNFDDIIPKNIEFKEQAAKLKGLQQILDYSELVVNELFGQKNSLTKEEFIQKMQEDFNWLLSQKAIRNKLQA